MKIHTAVAQALAVSVLAVASAADAQQAYPNKPIKWIVPYTPAGISDNVTRMVTRKIQDQTGWSFLVDNKPGANSILGVDLTAKSAPDGYTFVTVIAAHAANATLYAGKLPYDPIKSFAPVSLVAIAPLMLMANNDFPAKDVKDLIAYAKANPKKVFYGSTGIGAGAHLTMELFAQTVGIDTVHVPYKGTPQAVMDLMSGNIQIMVDSPSSSMSQVRSGKIKALGMFSRKRVTGALEVPTMAEAGDPALESSTWVLFLAPAGTPADIVRRMSTEVAEAIATNEVKSRLEAISMEIVGSTPEQAGKFLDSEIAKWAKVIKTAGVKIE